MSNSTISDSRSLLPPITSQRTTSHEIPVGNITLSNGTQKGVSVILLDQFGNEIELPAGMNYLTVELAERVRNLAQNTVTTFNNVPQGFSPAFIARDRDSTPRLECLSNTGREFLVQNEDNNYSLENIEADDNNWTAAKEFDDIEYG